MTTRSQALPAGLETEVLLMEHSYELSGYRKAEALWLQDASGLAATPSLY
jgi:hypothetical protein